MYVFTYVCVHGCSCYVYASTHTTSHVLVFVYCMCVCVCVLCSWRAASARVSLIDTKVTVNHPPPQLVGIKITHPQDTPELGRCSSANSPQSKIQTHTETHTAETHTGTHTDRGIGGPSWSVLRESKEDDSNHQSREDEGTYCDHVTQDDDDELVFIKAQQMHKRCVYDMQ